MARQERPNHQPQDIITRTTLEERPRPTNSVGDQLRIARERRGQGIFEVADYLRIKPDYLSALERGAYDRLPAHAYVVGFLRSYAEYLGLDSMMLRAAYREEVSGQAKAPQLLMPQPLPEGKMPHLLLILGGILFAVCVYAVWYFSVSNDRAVLDSPVLTATDGSAAAETATPNPQGINSLTAIPLATTPAQVEANTAQPPPVTEPESAQSAQQSVDAPKNVDVPETNDKPAQGARVVIRAIRDCLITVTDAKGKTVYNHVLTSGSVYKVPAESGYKLTTTSAGSIVITLDGKDLPKFGNVGQSLRNIALDPDHLAPKVP
ncbi:MAG: RodZ domain-containing protein [Alphaproteobacteria bacterium]